MKDVSRKPDTLRSARATATLRCPPFCLELLRNRNTEKGDALAAARIAGIMAAKRTPDLIPLCHPLPLQTVDITHTLQQEGAVYIEARVETIANTGVEMEALTAASIAALTLYDMLKPHAGTELSIGDTRLLEKRGGKSQYKRRTDLHLSAAVIVLSDSVAAGEKNDRAGLILRDSLQEAGLELAGYEILPDEPEQLRLRVRHWCNAGVDLILTCGGTGVGPRDRTVEALAPMIERDMPGIVETARAFGQRRMPYAMLSRGVAGLIGQTLLVTCPGSSGGAREYMDALLPGLLHVFQVLRSHPHEHSHGT